MTIGAVLFDFDGVLVESEYAGNRRSACHKSSPIRSSVISQRTGYRSAIALPIARA